MRGLLQTVCVIAFALGAGLFATGLYLRPKLDLADPAAVARDFDLQPEEKREQTARFLGSGIGFMVLGSLGLAVPWINTLLYRPANPSSPRITDAS